MIKNCFQAGKRICHPRICFLCFQMWLSIPGLIYKLSELYSFIVLNHDNLDKAYFYITKAHKAQPNSY